MRVLIFAVAAFASGPALAAAPAQPAPAAAKPASAPTAATVPAAGDALRGEKRFKALCGTCHTFDPAKKTIGPHLKGVMGRKAGTVAGFNYSQGMKAAGWSWDAARMDPYLARPGAVVKGTKMVNIVANAKDRADIIAYLTTVR
jgi:cytochrome c